MEKFFRTWVFLLFLVCDTYAQNATVSVSCGSSHLMITVPVDLFGIGVSVGANELMLGSGCTVTAVHQDVLQLEYPLSACGATMKLLPGNIHYRNILHYVPSTLNGVVRTSPFSHSIDCFYPRSWNVSSLGLKPTWIPFSSTLMDSQRLDFSLEVYDSTWSQPVSEPTYSLGDLINIQASVKESNHVPLKIYVDECVARPSAEASVKYEVITNHGCLVDGQHSRSGFVATSKSGILRFQLDTFTFIGTSSNQVYLVCHLKAVSAGSTDSRNKACSYDRTTATWSSHEGGDCSCCASPAGCGSRRKREEERKGLLGRAAIKLGPITVTAVQVTSSMMPGYSLFELISMVTSPAKPLRAAWQPHSHLTNTIMGEETKESSSSRGLQLSFSIATLGIVVACTFVVFVSILGYCLANNCHRGLERVRAATVESGAVASEQSRAPTMKFGMAAKEQPASV